MKHLICVNGNAGSYNDAFKGKIAEAFKGLDHEVYETTGPKSLIPFLKDYLKKNSKETVRVYACGGDGTAHEAANALVGFDNAELAIVAIGTGNDFVKIYGGKDKFQEFKPLIEGQPIEIDVSKIEGSNLNEPWYSVNVINFGFDAIVGAMGNYYKEHGLPKGV
jgi:diacylglycerol kinase (ATP)